MSDTPFLLTTDAHGTATVTLNRPDLHNAFNADLIEGLTETFKTLGEDDAVRRVVLTGAGKSFSAGADINWMRAAAEYNEAHNREDAMRLGWLMLALYELPKPTLALVNGAAIGGGTGLVACCDIAIAADNAKFAFSEVRLGLEPSVISPYVIAAIGARQARRYFLTAERFDAATAQTIGLVHEVVPLDTLESRGQAIIAELIQGGPHAQASAKDLVATVADMPIGDETLILTASRIAKLRVSPEGQEGLAAFLEKRPAAWRS